jgi:hypothetical protein
LTVRLRYLVQYLNKGVGLAAGPSSEPVRRLTEDLNASKDLHLGHVGEAEDQPRRTGAAICVPGLQGLDLHTQLERPMDQVVDRVSDREVPNWLLVNSNADNAARTTRTPPSPPRWPASKR